VIGLQEVLGFPGMPSQADEIAAGTGWHVHYAPAWHIGGGLTYGNAILSKHPLVDAAVLPLPTPDGVDTRSVAFARVDVPGGPVPLFVTHLTFQHHLGHVRCRQVRALTDHVAAHAPIDGPAADRAWATSTPTPTATRSASWRPDPARRRLRLLRGRVGRHRRRRAGRRPGLDLRSPQPYALRSREPSRRIDYVFARGPDRHLRGEPLAAWVALDQPVGGVWPSDHYAVVAEIQVAVRPHDPF
jgi:endonuclease/exonuclease/phosphatase family metal-dependent hydrolase